MLQPRNVSSSKKLPARKIQKIKSLPSPIGGLNSRDALSAMPPTDAYALINWIPQQYGVSSRKGYAEWATGLGASVGSVFNWFGPTTTIPSTSNFQTAPTSLPGKVFASTDAKIYDITNKGAGPASVVTLSGTTSAGIISSIAFSNSAGGWLLACSETDGYFTYDGTTWVKVTLGAGGTQVSGSDPTKFCAVMTWKTRPWFVIKNTSKIAYLPANAIYGAAVELDLGPMLHHGGAVAWIATWTIDAGTGVDDMLVIGGENGDIIIYKGTDPASPTTFALVGVWYAGELPKGRKCFSNFGGDLLIVSNLGIIPLSYLTRGGANILTVGTGDYTTKIQQTFATDISPSFNFFGWEILQIPRENLMLITVPAQQQPLFSQYALNTSNNQWCQFQGIPANCVKSVANWPMAGTIDGRVLILFTNFRDNNLVDGTLGQPISGVIAPAFSYFQEQGELSSNKHFLMARATWLSVAQPGFSMQMNTDFMPGIPSAINVVTPAVGALWDVAVWDAALWAGGQKTWAQWQTVQGYGFSGQMSMTTLVQDATLLASIDYMMEPGGPM